MPENQTARTAAGQLHARELLKVRSIATSPLSLVALRKLEGHYITVYGRCPYTNEPLIEKGLCLAASPYIIVLEDAGEYPIIPTYVLTSFPKIDREVTQISETKPKSWLNRLGL